MIEVSFLCSVQRVCQQSHNNSLFFFNNLYTLLPQTRQVELPMSLRSLLWWKCSIATTNKIRPFQCKFGWLCRNDKNECDLELKILGTYISLRLQNKLVLGSGLSSPTAAWRVLCLLEHSFFVCKLGVLISISANLLGYSEN